MDVNSTNGDSPAPEAASTPQDKSFFRVIVHSFFIVPFLIAVGCVLLFAAIKLLTQEQRTVYDYLEDVKTGGQTKRWQGAFELSKILASPEMFPQDDRFRAELISAFDHAQHDDLRVRQYLALAMGRTGRIEFADVLLKSLAEEREENLPASIYALGMLRDQKAASALAAYVDHPEPRIRSITVAALGSIADPSSKEALLKGLEDAEPNVQWGAAIALGQMGGGEGREILLKLLNREYLEAFPEVDREEQNDLMLGALAASARLNDPELNAVIEKIAATETNMKIRAEAMKTHRN